MQNQIKQKNMITKWESNQVQAWFFYVLGRKTEMWRKEECIGVLNRVGILLHAKGTVHPG
jgi:hypothetical protein